VVAAAVRGQYVTSRGDAARAVLGHRAYCAALTLLMLKSDTRTGGMAVRVK
jgi:hypothetical protein